MANKPLNINKKKLLLVEGSTDGHFCGILLNKLGIKDVQIVGSLDNLGGIDIVSVGGISKFKTRLENLQLVSGFRNVEKIGIIADSDNNLAEDTFNEIKIKVLKPCGFNLPNKLNELSTGTIKTIIHIIDCNEKKGCLESLCLQAIKHDYAIPVIENFEKTIKTFPSDKEPECLYKSKVQVYMASMKALAHYPALGAKKGYFDLDNSVFDDLKSFLKLFAK